MIEQGGPEAGRYDRAISIGIALPHAVVDQLPERKDRAVAIGYLTHGYAVVNNRLNETASRLAGLLQRMGHRALPVGAAQRVDKIRICGFFSHKMAARLAGLGWIGKNCLLITPDMGLAYAGPPS